MIFEEVWKDLLQIVILTDWFVSFFCCVCGHMLPMCCMCCMSCVLRLSIHVKLCNKQKKTKDKTILLCATKKLTWKCVDLPKKNKTDFAKT